MSVHNSFTGGESLSIWLIASIMVISMLSKFFVYSSGNSGSLYTYCRDDQFQLVVHKFVFHLEIMITILFNFVTVFMVVKQTGALE